MGNEDSGKQIKNNIEEFIKRNNLERQIFENFYVLFPHIGSEEISRLVRKTMKEFEEFDEYFRLRKEGWRR